MQRRCIGSVVRGVEEGAVTRAADAAHVTQPALSEGIRRLEAEKGLELFHRVGRRALLSSAGEAFLEPARQVLRDLGVLRTSVAAVRGPPPRPPPPGAVPPPAGPPPPAPLRSLPPRPPPPPRRLGPPPQ